jgi:phthalate 4,5-dioxygenase oxygenase subunit
MLTVEENERICRVGPGTPMGAALHCYWLPAMLSSDLPEPDCPPRRVQLLGEDYVAFRDTNGNIGLLDELCSHRGASLALGRVEDCGIRCLYHGWKYGVDGRIQDTPNMPNPQFKERFKAAAYSVYEAGEIVWVYLGPQDAIPPKPDFRFFHTGSEHRVVRATVQNANYVQILEGVVDSSHASILHQDRLATAGHFDDSTSQNLLNGRSPRIELVNTEFGFCSVALRAAGDGAKTNARVTPYMAPIYALVPPDAIFAAAVPMNDEKTLFITAFLDEERPIGVEPLRTEIMEYFGVTDEILARMGLTHDTYGSGDAANPGNGYLQDRAAMKSGSSFTGIPPFVPEDAVVCMSMGPLYDRSREHLVPADAGVIRMRRLLSKCATLAEKGEAPIGVGVDMSEIRARDIVLEPGQAWIDFIGTSSTDAW